MFFDIVIDMFFENHRTVRQHRRSRQGRTRAWRGHSLSSTGPNKSQLFICLCIYIYICAYM